MHPHTLAILIPAAPILPDPEPPFVQAFYDYQQLKAYRLQSQPYIVRANYDRVQMMIEDGILEKRVREYIDWLSWVQANL